MISMHKAGWVHRDLNPANLLVQPKSNRMGVKIADLEYAKSLIHTTGHAIRSVRPSIRILRSEL